MRLRLKRLFKKSKRTNSRRSKRINSITKISNRSDYNRLIDISTNF